MADQSVVNPEERPTEPRFIPLAIVNRALAEDSPTEDLLSDLDSLLEVGMAAILEGGALSNAQYAGMYSLRAAHGVVSELQRRCESGTIATERPQRGGGAA